MCGIAGMAMGLRAASMIIRLMRAEGPFSSIIRRVTTHLVQGFCFRDFHSLWCRHPTKILVY